jgi:predicted Zn-dependent protease
MNLFLAAGDTPAADLVSGVERGLLVTRFHYVNGFLDTRRALMTGMTRDGTFLIENGQIAGPVRDLRFTQGYVDALNNVGAVGRALKLVLGDIGGGARLVPALKINSWNFTGVKEAQY